MSAAAAAAASQPSANDSPLPCHGPAVVAAETIDNERTWDEAVGVGGQLPAYGTLSSLPLYPAISAAPRPAGGHASPAPAVAPGRLPQSALQLLQQLSSAGLAGFQPLSADPAAVGQTVLQPSAARLAAGSGPVGTAAQAAVLQAASQAALLQQLQSQLFGMPAPMVQAKRVPLLAEQQSKNSSISTQHSLPSLLQHQAPLQQQQQQQGPRETVSAGSADYGAGSGAAGRRAAALRNTHLAPSSSAEAWLGPGRPAAGNAAAAETAMADSLHDAQRANSGSGLHSKHGAHTTDTVGKQGGGLVPGKQAASLPAAAGVELPAKLPAHLRKKVRIIQPISATWEQEALQTAAITTAAGQQASAKVPLGAVAGAAEVLVVPDKYKRRKLIQGSASAVAAMLAVDSGGPGHGDPGSSSRGSGGRFVNIGSTVHMRQQPYKQPMSSSSLQRGSPDAAGITLPAVHAAAPGGAVAATANIAADGSSSGGSGTGSDEGDLRASNSPKPAQGSSSPRSRNRHQQQRSPSAEAGRAPAHQGAAGLVATAATSAEHWLADANGARAAADACMQRILSASVAAVGSKLSVDSAAAAAAAPDTRQHHPKGPKPAPAPAAMSWADGQSQCTGAQANAANVRRHAMHPGCVGNKLSLASSTASQLAAIVDLAASGVGSSREVAAPVMQAGGAPVTVDGAVWATPRGTAAIGAPISSACVDDEGAGSDREDEAISEQASSEGESEGEEQDVQEQLQPETGPGKQQQQLSQSWPRSDAHAAKIPSTAAAAAGTDQTANGLHLAAVSAGTVSPTVAAVGAVSSQAAALQAVLAAGMPGHQGMGILSPGLGLWSHLQGRWGALAQQDPVTSAPQAAAGPVTGMLEGVGIVSAGTPMGAAHAAAAGGGAAQAPGLAQLLGFNTLAASPAASAALGGYDPVGANPAAAVLQQLRGPMPAFAAPAGFLNPTSVCSQLDLLYSWYASNRAAYLEQVQVLLQLAERDRMMAAALGPMAAAARPPALRALDKALEIIRGSQALEQYCRTATTTTATESLAGATSVPAAAAAAVPAAASQGSPATAGTAAEGAPQQPDGPWGSVAAAAFQPASSFGAGHANMFTSTHRDGQAAPQGPGSAAAAATTIAAMLHQQSSQAVTSGVVPAAVAPTPAAAALPQSPAGNPINPVAQLQQQLQQQQQQLQAPLAQMQQAVLGSRVNPLLQLAQLARIKQQQQQQQQQAAALLAPLAALAAAAGNTLAASEVQQQFSHLLDQQTHQQLKQQQQWAQQIGQLQAAKLLCQQGPPTGPLCPSPSGAGGAAAAPQTVSLTSAGPREQPTHASPATASPTAADPAKVAGSPPAATAGFTAAAVVLAAAQGAVNTAKRARVADMTTGNTVDMARKKLRAASDTAPTAAAHAALQPLPGMPMLQNGLSGPTPTAADPYAARSIAAAVAALLAQQ